MADTVYDLADKVLDELTPVWDRTEGRTAIAVAARLGPDDEKAVRRIVAAAGHTGADADTVAKEVADRVVAKVIALKDVTPADHGD